MNAKLIAATLSALLLAVSASAWACSAAGPNRHVGKLLAVDRDAKSFTVLDAESRQPVTFHADESLLEGLKGVEGTILVEYEGEGSNLTATHVQR